MRGAEGFVQVVMQYIDAQIAGAEHTQQGIHVGAVAINQASGRVHDAHYFRDVLVEEA